MLCGHVSRAHVDTNSKDVVCSLMQILGAYRLGAVTQSSLLRSTSRSMNEHNIIFSHQNSIDGCGRD